MSDTLYSAKFDSVLREDIRSVQFVRRDDSRWPVKTLTEKAWGELMGLTSNGTATGKWVKLDLTGNDTVAGVFPLPKTGEGAETPQSTPATRAQAQITHNRQVLASESRLKNLQIVTSMIVKERIRATGNMPKAEECVQYALYLDECLRNALKEQENQQKEAKIEGNGQEQLRNDGHDDIPWD